MGTGNSFIASSLDSSGLVPDGEIWYPKKDTSDAQKLRALRGVNKYAIFLHASEKLVKVDLMECVVFREDKKIITVGIHKVESSRHLVNKSC